MIRITQLKVPYNHPELIEPKIKKLLKINKDENIEYVIKKESIDARKKPEIFKVYTIDVELRNEQNIKDLVETTPNLSFVIDKIFSPIKKHKNIERPVICGFGPAGLFAAYIFALNGVAPLVIERGESIENRVGAVENFWNTGKLNINSNVSFGEGGAGTFSDGKVNTGVKDPFGYGEFVLNTFVNFGADSSILYSSHPHIGTDKLQKIIPEMRKKIIALGGEIRFNTTLTDIGINKGQIVNITLNNNEVIPCTRLILATGHSSRDTFKMLSTKNLDMKSKSFAVGFRVEHPQEMIDKSMYGISRDQFLPPSPYRLSYTPEGGRGIYSFCMCPGGFVVNASSEKEGVCVNGMSYSGRDAKNANSAIVVAVTPKDFGAEDALAGVRYQQALEKKAFELCGGSIPQQLLGDYINNKKSTSFGEYSTCVKGASSFTNMRGLFSKGIENSFVLGMSLFGKRINGFNREDTILSGIEGRTSSPVRIQRDETFQSNIKGIYPCGEGAGYAGGITSAAMDGIKIAFSILGEE